MTKLIFLKPIFHEKIWGGTKLATNFGYDIPSDHTGECWAISAHKNGDCEVLTGEFKSMKLSTLWQEHRELFGNIEGDVFPLLSKILDASDDLSVQVHPDNEYGLRVEGELGKEECWYIIDADADATMIFGHNATTREEFAQMINDGKWKDLLTEIPVKKGDFFFVPAGTVHALKKGTLVLEIQQSSDTTYRLYDYDRLDDEGNLRPLHIEKSVDVSTIPHVSTSASPEVKSIQSSTVTTYVESQYFTVSKYDVCETLELTNDKPFLVISVLEGSGLFNGEAVTKGDHFIVPASMTNLSMTGNMSLMVGSI